MHLQWWQTSIKAETLFDYIIKLFSDVTKF